MSDTPEPSVEHGIHVDQAVTINRSRPEVYAFWRDFANLPQVMRHLHMVTVLDARRSHWVAAAPAGTSVEWDAETLEDRPNELIAWRAVGAAIVPNAGTVRFEDSSDGSGTVVGVHLEYHPPGGPIGMIVAKLFGESPDQQVSDDLRRFKQMMEAGEVTTTESQPSGRDLKGRDKPASHEVADGDEAFATTREQSEGVVREASEESFPASDAPSWTGRRQTGAST